MNDSSRPQRPDRALLGLHPDLEHGNENQLRPSEPSVTSSIVKDYGNRQKQARGGPAFSSQGSNSQEAVQDQDQALAGIGDQVNGDFHNSKMPSQVRDADLGSSPQLAGVKNARDLKRVANELMKPSNRTNGTKDYLPGGDLEEVFQPSVVKRVLTSIYGNDRDRDRDRAKVDEYTDIICGQAGADNPMDAEAHSCRKIFAILVLIKEADLIGPFIESGLRDKDLPLEWANSTASATSICRDHLCRLGTSDRVTCFDEGDKGTLREFFNAQWMVCVPFIGLNLNGQVAEYHIHEEAIMPWTFFGREVKSGFSSVRKLKIHPDHNGFEDHESFALKALDTPGTEIYQHELKAFWKMKKGPHLLELCATFKRGGMHSFLFPWANGGDLEQLWGKQPPKLLGGKVRLDPRVFVLWIAEQFCGLTDGLSGIHDIRDEDLRVLRKVPGNSRSDLKDYGIHGDLKPKNILHFSQTANDFGLGVLKISDFGLTRFHQHASRSALVDLGRPPSPAYSAPEETNQDHDKSRKCDIWSLGCVFSEFLAWAIRGPQGVRSFRDKRLNEKDTGRAGRWKSENFFRSDFENKVLKANHTKVAVREYLEALRAEVCPSRLGSLNFFADLIDFIKNRMLVVMISQRANCAQLRQFLENAKQKPIDDPYWVHHLPSFTQNGSLGSRTTQNGVSSRRQ